MRFKQNRAIFYAVFAAALYAISSPVSKLLLQKIPAILMAALLYLGAGIGLSAVGLIQKITNKPQTELPLMRKDLPYTVWMVVLDIAAPILLMIGLTITTAANASLLNNFEIVATAMIALWIFKESISRRLWIAIILVTVSIVLLFFEDRSSLHFSFGSIFVLLACVCWGFENNCTRMLSTKNPLQIVVIKGLFSGFVSLLIAILVGESICDIRYILAALILGFVSYGLSIFFYILAQRKLGAAKTSTYYAIAPFIGAIFSFVIFDEIPTTRFLIAFIIMVAGTYFASSGRNKSSVTKLS